jgi:hypothetical protein
MDGFDFPDDLPDDDPAVVAGMERLRRLRDLEIGIPEMRSGLGVSR